MHHSELVQIGHSGSNLPDVVGDCSLIQGGIPHELIVEVALPHLHDQIDLLSTNMVPVGWQDVRVLTKEVYLEFVDQKLQLCLILPKSLDSSNKTNVVGNCLDYLPCLTFPQCPKHPELSFAGSLWFSIPNHSQCFAQTVTLALLHLLTIFSEVLLSPHSLEVNLQVGMFLPELLELWDRSGSLNFWGDNFFGLSSGVADRGFAVRSPGLDGYFDFEILGILMRRVSGIGLGTDSDAYDGGSEVIGRWASPINLSDASGSILGLGPVSNDAFKGRTMFLIGLCSSCPHRAFYLLGFLIIT